MKLIFPTIITSGRLEARFHRHVPSNVDSLSDTHEYHYKVSPSLLLPRAADGCGRTQSSSTISRLHIGYYSQFNCRLLILNIPYFCCLPRLLAGSHVVDKRKSSFPSLFLLSLRIEEIKSRVFALSYCATRIRFLLCLVNVHCRHNRPEKESSIYQRTV